MKQAPAYTLRSLFSVSVVIALCSFAAMSGHAQTTKPPYENALFHDSHFHLTNYIQEGIDVKTMLGIMGDKVGRSTLFGIPLQQQWSHRVTGNFAPKYYLDSDAPLYYYSFTDAYIAMAYKSLTPEEQKRFDPMITGFNPTDMYAAAHIRRVLETFPGVFTGIGEFSIHKEFVSPKISGDVASLTDPALDSIFSFCEQTGLLIILHNDVDDPFPKANTPNYLDELKKLFKRHPNATIIWAHVGVGRIVAPPKEYIKFIEPILSDPELKHVHFDISWDETAKYVVHDETSLANTVALINKYPDRVLFGTDNVAPATQEQHLKVYHIYDPLWAKLTPDASQKVRKGNYERLFDAAAAKVRAWEKANVGKPKKAPEPTPARVFGKIKAYNREAIEYAAIPIQNKTFMTQFLFQRFKSRTVLLLLLLWTTISCAQDMPAPSQPVQFGVYTPNAGFRLASTDKGTVNFRIYTYIRYLNQKGLDSTYTNSFGQTSSLDRRQDIQLNKVNIQFNGWLLDPKFRYLLYAWTNNTAQGQGAQVVIGGNLHYAFNEHFILGGGINSLPGVRSTEGNFPFWLTVDNRVVADEFFRPSYTMGIWARGAIIEKLNYNVMLGNNLSQLGVDAGQLDDGINTFSGALVWHPTTGEFGLNDNFGDFENHQKVATRLAGHYSRSDEDKQGVPASEAFENVTIRLSDGSVIFAPNLFGAGIQIENATYQMLSFDAGAKYKGFSLEGAYYWRRVNNLTGRGTETLNLDELLDNGFHIQASGMLLPQKLQLYGTWSTIFGEYGDPWEFRAGLNWHPWKNHVVRWNFEYILMEKSPVGGLSLPFPVGGTGNIFYSSFQVNF